MRDPERISKLLELVRGLWYAHPDLRLGQLLVNLESDNLFYIEDGVLEFRLRHALHHGFEMPKPATAQVCQICKEPMLPGIAMAGNLAGYVWHTHCAAKGSFGV